MSTPTTGNLRQELPWLLLITAVLVVLLHANAPEVTPPSKKRQCSCRPAAQSELWLSSWGMWALPQQPFSSIRGWVTTPWP